ncbi:MAG: MlaD family protein [Gammaproteobacteria bacterium]|nr:MlaD family protein [Gammaproteobacteria bacterium]
MQGLVRYRYAHEAVGALVVLSLVIFFAAMSLSGRVREWMDPGATLRVVLPKDGLFGLAEGAEVEILGTKAGKVRRIVIDPERRMYADVRIERSMQPFVRRDSEAVIRKRFGVAGASYLEITRGQGEPTDWAFAVINAVAERAPTETVGELLEELRAKVFPVIDDVQRTVRAAASLIERLDRDDGPLVGTLANLEDVTGDVKATTGDLPALVQRTQSLLTSADRVMADLARTTPELPAIAKNASAATRNVPALLTQVQQTTLELERLLAQLRTHWLLGGGGGGAVPEPTGRLPAREARP